MSRRIGPIPRFVAGGAKVSVARRRSAVAQSLIEKAHKVSRIRTQRVATSWVTLSLAEGSLRQRELSMARNMVYRNSRAVAMCALPAGRGVDTVSRHRTCGDDHGEYIERRQPERMCRCSMQLRR